MSDADTKEQIITVGRSMVQSHGCNFLSFREIAKAIGAKSASIHYHFPTKDDLCATLAPRYSEDATTYFNEIEAKGSEVAETCKQYTAIFRSALVNNNRMCLCGIMAAEYGDLPPEVCAEVDNFTDVNVAWLSRMMSRNDPSLSADEVRDRSVAIFAAIEGAQLVARGRDDIGVFDRAMHAYESV